MRNVGASVPCGAILSDHLAAHGGSCVRHGRAYLCEISTSIAAMTSPCVADERSAIVSFMQNHGTSPFTGQLLRDRTLRPNTLVKSQIVAWRDANEGEVTPSTSRLVR